MTLRYVADGERYIVMLGTKHIGFVRRYYPISRIRQAARWNAADAYMIVSRDFPTRQAAGEWLSKQAERDSQESNQ